MGSGRFPGSAELGLTDNLLQHPECYAFCTLVPSLVETVIEGGCLWVKGKLPLPFGSHSKGRLNECVHVREWHLEVHPGFAAISQTTEEPLSRCISGSGNIPRLPRSGRNRQHHSLRWQRGRIRLYSTAPAYVRILGSLSEGPTGKQRDGPFGGASRSMPATIRRYPASLTVLGQ